MVIIIHKGQSFLYPMNLLLMEYMVTFCLSILTSWLLKRMDELLFIKLHSFLICPLDQKLIFLLNQLLVDWPQHLLEWRDIFSSFGSCAMSILVTMKQKVDIRLTFRKEWRPLTTNQQFLYNRLEYYKNLPLPWTSGAT